MARVGLIIKSIASYMAWFTMSLLFSIIMFPLVLLPASIRYDNRLIFFICNLWSRWFVSATWITIGPIEGAENIPLVKQQPAIFIANHASLLDIPLIGMHLKKQPHIWISNDYSKIPLFGFMLKRMFVLVKRHSAAHMSSVIKKTFDLAHNQQRHIIMFPEGTRHSDGNLHKFFSGFAVLAEKLNRPVIPIALVGCNKIFPKGSFLIDSSAPMVKMSIGKPIFFDSALSREIFIEQVHTQLAQEIARLRTSPEQ